MTVVDLRPQLPPIRDQGWRGTCLAFATTTAHETRQRAADDEEDLSTETLFWAAKELDGNRHDGTTFASIAGALCGHGQPPESAWPYDGCRNIARPEYSPPVAATDPTVLRYAWLSSIEVSLESVRAELASGNVVVVGIELWDEFELLAKGDLDLPGNGNLNGSYHAVVIVGYDKASACVLVRNSWGTVWGDGGYAWFPEGFVEQLVVRAAAVRSVAAVPP